MDMTGTDVAVRTVPHHGGTADRPDRGAADPTPRSEVGADAVASSEPVDTVLEIEDGDTTLFEAAITAFHANEFQRAESLFLEEAERSLEDAPQRAAIAYRQAALAARESGNLDGSDHWMRLAGREYLRVSEDPRTPLPFIRESAVMAAKCFLSVENLHVASKGLRRAQAIDSVLRADDDMMAGATGIPFHHEWTAGPADGRGDDHSAAEGSADGRDPEPLPPEPVVGLELVGSDGRDVTSGASARRAGWLGRFRRHPSGRHAA